ncbi:MAG: LutC/YkgG family protein [Ardenticatenaceae bacterium]
MQAREEILTRLRRTLARPNLRFPPEEPALLTEAERMAVTQAAGDGWALARRFGEELQALHGSFEIARTSAEARGALVQCLQRWVVEADVETDAHGREVLGWAEGSLPLSEIASTLSGHGFRLVVPDELNSAGSRAAVRSIRFGLTGVDAAFASTGSMLLVAGAGKSRAASLLPLCHIALIPFSRLYSTVEAWMAGQRSQGVLDTLIRENANVTIITGPSKSADIEMNLTLGVHGPQFVHAILFNDRSQ